MERWGFDNVALGVGSCTTQWLAAVRRVIMSIELLLANEKGDALLSEGLPDDAAVPKTRDEEGEFLGFPQNDKDPNDLESQPWAMIVPDDNEGKRLEEIMAPLR